MITTADELYAALLTAKAMQGPSENGLSIYGHASRCTAAGEFARGKRRSVRNEVPRLALDDKFAVGTYYHALKELSFAPGIADCIAVDHAYKGLALALRLFYKTAWFGTTTAVEIDLNGVGGLTGRADAVVELSVDDCNAGMEFEAFDLLPGLWLWDHKTAKGIKKDPREDLILSLQGPLYCKMYEKMTGVRPRGIVYDEVSKAENPKIARKFHVVHFSPQVEAILDAALAYADRATARKIEVNEPIFNPLACTVGMFTCPFAGFCPRLGDTNTVAQVIRENQFMESESDE